MLTRRALLGTAAATLAAPALAQTRPSFAARAADLDQIHSLIVRRDGAETFAQRYDGAGLGGIANVKSVSKTLLALLVGIGIDRGVLSRRGPAGPSASGPRALRRYAR